MMDDEVQITSSRALHIFTFHDHLFSINEETGEQFMQLVLEDEYGTRRVIDGVHDLTEIRTKCAEILQGYREEMSMSGAKP